MAAKKTSTNLEVKVRRSKVPHVLAEDGTMQPVTHQTKVEAKKDGRVRIPAESIDYIRINARQLGGTMSQLQLAKAIGISQPTVSYIIHGKIRANS